MEDYTQIGLQEVDENYRTFVDKFKRKLTTDDCYTPENIYNAVADWTRKEYGLEGARFVRPFWPDTDYRTFAYAAGDVVVDNPPFSILAEIVRWYSAQQIPFLLFGHALTILSGYKPGMHVCYICTGADVVFENGAVLKVSFVTNLETDGTLVRSAPDLYDAIDIENRKNVKQTKKELPKYCYTDDVVTAGKMQWYTQHHTPFKVNRNDAVFIRALDSQRTAGKTIFGGGFLLSEKAAAEKAAAEKAAAEKAAAIRWELSDREKEIQRNMNR